MRDFKLYYLARDPEGTAFLDELSSDEWRSSVKIHHDLGDPIAMLADGDDGGDDGGQKRSGGLINLERVHGI